MGKLADIAADLLATAVAALDDPPARQIVTVGASTEPLQDEQLAVAFLRVFRGVPGGEDPGPQYDNGERTAELAVRLSRCVATSTRVEDTNPELLSAAATVVCDDAVALVDALWQWRPPNAHTTTGRDTSSTSRWVGPVVANRPQGFAHGVTIIVHAML